jgi:hypothetical protein
MLHRCTEAECPSFGQRTSYSCGCHETDETVLRAALKDCLEALDRAAGTSLGIALSGSHHPNPDGALMEVYEACQKAASETRAVLSEAAS